MGEIAKARGVLENCATNQAAHFGGPHGMFVDVPVADLLALLNAHKSAVDALEYISETDVAYLKAPQPGTKGYPGHLGHVARKALSYG